MTHQLKSRFHIASLNDIVLLCSLYGKDTRGRLVFTYNAEKKKKNRGKKFEQRSMTVEWTTDPFGTLYRLVTTTTTTDRLNGYIVSHLLGASTLLGVAQQPTRLDKASYDDDDGDAGSGGSNKHDLVVWADYIDQRVHTEMRRKNDIGWLWQRPRAPMPSMQALFTAVRLSQYGTHCLPCLRGFVVTNPEAVYPVYFGIDGGGGGSGEEKEEVVHQALVFDKDDGFLDLATGARAWHLNRTVEAWRQDCCSKPLQSYMDQYGPAEAYHKIHKSELTEFTGGKRKRSDDGNGDPDSDIDDNPTPYKKDKKNDDNQQKCLEDVILRHVAIMCGLDRPLATPLLSPPDNTKNNFLQQFSDCGVDDAQLTVETCWDYVCVGQEDGKGPYRRLAELIEERRGADESPVSTADIGLTLRRLTYQWGETYPYQLVAVVPVSSNNNNESPTRYRLVPQKNTNNKRLYKAVDYRISPLTGMAVIAVSVAFLKKRLGALLSDDVIMCTPSSSEEESIEEELRIGVDDAEVYITDGWDEGIEPTDNEDGERLE